MIFKRGRKKWGLQEFSREEKAQIEAALGNPIGSVVPVANLTAYIARLEGAAASDPGNWIYQYWLGDFYSRDKRYIEAKRTLDRMLELAPDDPRALYAAASIYRTLTYAYMTAPEIAPLMPQVRQQMRMAGVDDSGINPEESQAALTALRLPLQEAYKRAIDLFERTRKHRLKLMDQRIVDLTLQSAKKELRNLQGGLE